MCLFAYDLGFVVPEDLEVRDPADLKYLRVPVCGLAPGAVYDPGIFVTDGPALSRAASESRSRTAAWARGRCQGGAGRGRRQVLRKLSAAGRQRARPAAWHGGRRVARGDVELAVVACAPASLGSPSPLPRTARRRPCAHSARDFSHSLRPRSAQGGAESPPPCARSGPFSGGRSAWTMSSGWSVLAATWSRRCGPARWTRPPGRLSSLRSTRARVCVAVWRLKSALGAAAVAVERVSRSRWGPTVPEVVGRRSEADSRLFDRPAATAAVSVDDGLPRDKPPTRPSAAAGARTSDRA